MMMGYHSNSMSWIDQVYSHIVDQMWDRVRCGRLRVINEERKKIMRKAIWCESTEAIVNVLKVFRSDHLINVVISWSDLLAKDGKLDYPVLLGLCVYGEARGESVLGQIAVSEVVFNRYQPTDYTVIEEILLQRLQFSCFNRGNKSLDGAMNCVYNEVYRYCSQAGIVLGCCDRVRSRVLKPDATLYMSEAAWKRIALRWAQQKDDAWDITRLKPRGQIDRHIFFAE